MLITKPQVYTIAELREMIKGFEMLFGQKPCVRIEVHGPHGNPSGTRDYTTNEITFFPSDGFECVRLGNRYIECCVNANETILIAPDDNLVTFHAAFYLR